jgi:hypothetical protein
MRPREQVFEIVCVTRLTPAQRSHARFDAQSLREQDGGVGACYDQQ